MPSAKAAIDIGDLGPAAERCADPQLLPERKLTQEEVERYWAKDRANLVVCRDQKGAIVAYFKDLRTRFVSSGK